MAFRDTPHWNPKFPGANMVEAMALNAMKELPRDMQRLLNWIYWLDLREREVATEMGLDLPFVRRQHNLALRRLRHEVEPTWRTLHGLHPRPPHWGHAA